MTLQAKKKATAEVLARYRKETAEIERGLSQSIRDILKTVEARRLAEVRQQFLPND